MNDYCVLQPRPLFKQISLAVLIFCLCIPAIGYCEPSSHWADKSHNWVNNSAHDFSQWIDDFFHSENYEVESADSYMRLRLTQLNYETEPDELDVGFRGRISLPALSKRVTLVIYDNDEEPDDEDGPEQNTLRSINPQDDHGTNVALQFTEFDEGHHRLDYRVGIRSSGAFKSALRYRFRRNINDNQSLQITNRLRFRGDEGFEERLRLRHDTLIDNDYVLRLLQTFRYSKLTDGTEWETYLGLTRKLNQTSAVTTFTEWKGITQPDNLITEYGLGVNYRQQLNRKWLYFETRPVYYFERETKQVQRDGRWRIYFQLEVIFD